MIRNLGQRCCFKVTRPAPVEVPVPYAILAVLLGGVDQLVGLLEQSVQRGPRPVDGYHTDAEARIHDLASAMPPRTRGLGPRSGWIPAPCTMTARHIIVRIAVAFWRSRRSGLSQPPWRLWLPNIQAGVLL
ncbi:MAG TPA: hypothetical protein VJ801_16700 [Polyangia bacterium]|jgi:hypothetical protein|nr:hypothetical protein [Polyangia bacterium]